MSRAAGAVLSTVCAGTPSRPRHRPHGALAWLAVASGLAGVAPAFAVDTPDVFDRVVASVNEVVITQSEVDLMTRVRLVREKQGAALGRPLSAAQRNTSAEQLINQALIYNEARRLAFQQISPEDVEGQLNDFRGRFTTPAGYQVFLQKHEVTERELTLRFQRMLLGFRFARDQVRLNIKVTDLQVSEYLARHAGEAALAGKRPEEARELARAALLQAAFPAALQEWVASLRKRARVRVLVVYR